MSFETRVWRKGATRAQDVLVSTTTHKPFPSATPKPLREDTRLWIIGPKAPEPTRQRPPLRKRGRQLWLYNPKPQRKPETPGTHVHDPDWCYGQPKSTTGYLRDLPQLPNGVSRYDVFSNPDLEDPEAELRWLIATKDLPQPTTLQWMRWHALEATTTLNTIGDEDRVNDAEPDEPEPDEETDDPAIESTRAWQTDWAIRLSAPVIRRIEWERQQAQNGPVTKYYLAEAPDELIEVSAYQGDGFVDATTGEHREAALKVFHNALDTGLRWSGAINTIDEYQWRRGYYGNDWKYSLLDLPTLATLATDDGKTLFWDLQMPDPEPYRLDLVEDDDDIHHPRPGHQSTTLADEVREVLADAAEGIFDEAYGDLDEHGIFHIDQHWRDVLNIANAQNDFPVSLDVDGTLELGDRVKRIVLPEVERLKNHDHSHCKPGPHPWTAWYSQWTTKRHRDISYRTRNGRPMWETHEWEAIERADNIDWCDCRVCRRHLRKQAWTQMFKRRIRVINKRKSA